MTKASRMDVWREVADESLMARYASGDVEAFEELFRRYERRAFAFFVKRTGSPERAEDLYQELFLRLHRARDAYDPDRPFQPWFFQIAHRLLVDDVRRAFRAREVPFDEQGVVAAPGFEGELVDRDEVARLLARLGPGERFVLIASKVEGAEYPELAERSGRSVAAIKKMASRAMRRIRSHHAVEPARSSRAGIG